MAEDQPATDPLQPRDANEDARIDELITQVQTRITRIITSYVKPADFVPPDAQPVVVASWMKSGTTLTQQLVYQLLVQLGHVKSDPTGMDFDDISSVVPFIEMTQLGPSRSVHPYEPTVWKTHSLPSQFLTPAYENARFLVAVRRGRAVMRSFADFAAEWVGGQPIPADIRPAFYERFFRCFFLGCADTGRGDLPPEPVEWFSHVRDWRDAAALRGRVLFLIYEDVVRDMPGTVRDVARFIGVGDGLTDEVVAEVARRCSRENMVGDPRFLDKLVAKAMGLDQQGGERVRAEGKPGGFKDVVTKQSEADFDRMFEAAFGVKTYDELAEQLRARNREVLG